MSKTIEAWRLIGEYPGLTRTIQVFDDKIIEVEFNFIDSDEIGIRFWKHYTDAAAENKILQDYFANSMPRVPKESITRALEKASWITLVQDTIDGTVKLPDNGYKYHGSFRELADNLAYLKKKW